MQLVVWDIVRADQFLNDFVLNKDSSLNSTVERTKLYQQVFAVHKTNQEQFRESFSFYKSHPEYFKTILDSINVQSNKAPTEIYQPKPLNDSLVNDLDTARKKFRKLHLAN
jgi:hypothetical protein